VCSDFGEIRAPSCAAKIGTIFDFFSELDGLSRRRSRVRVPSLPPISSYTRIVCKGSHHTLHVMGSSNIQNVRPNAEVTNSAAIMASHLGLPHQKKLSVRPGGLNARVVLFGHPTCTDECRLSGAKRT
jgi:hypothetical protein